MAYTLKALDTLDGLHTQLALYAWHSSTQDLLAHSTCVHLHTHSLTSWTLYILWLALLTVT